MTKDVNFYQNILSCINDAIIVVSKDFKVLEINCAAERICEVSVEKVHKSHIKDIFLYNSYLLSLTYKVLNSGKSYFDKEYSFSSRNYMKHVSLSVSISPFFHNSSDIIGAIIILHDISLLKELEEKNKRNEHLKSINTIAASMAHEIKNPLGGIRGASQLLKDEIKNKEHIEYLTVLIKEVDRINIIMEDLLTFSKIPSPKFSKINIHKILEDVLFLQKQTNSLNKVTINKYYDPSIPLVYADENQMVQVFLNIIKNSFEAMPNGGDLTIITKVLFDYHLMSSDTNMSFQMLSISIQDSGPGISDENYKKIFTPFFTTKKKGSGLGLSICSQIIDAHNGIIKIRRNKDSSGTNVQIFLPLG